MCTHVGVMSVGRMVWQGSLAELAAQQRVRVRVETGRAGGSRRGAAPARAWTRSRSPTAGASAVLGDAEPERVVAALVAAGVGVRGFAVERPRLEDVFVGLTGEGFDVSG